jgi:hypothetical protein
MWNISFFPRNYFYITISELEVWWLRPLLCYGEYTYDCKLKKNSRNIIVDFDT